jgi:uncharacterized membrane protein YhaH (DUF805 family)
MRGEVLKPEDATGPGLILGEDQRRYSYTAARVHRGQALSPGTPVDFIALGEEARDIYVLSRPSAPPPLGVTDAAYTPAVAVRADGLLTYFLRTLSRNYFQFYGRARRAEYWGFILFWLITLAVLLIADAFLSAALFSGNAVNDPDFFPLLTGLFYLYSIIPGMAVTIRRLHDQDITGWFYLINFIPYIGGIILFILMIFDSRPNPNKHGPSPKYGPAQTVNVFS